MPPPLKRTKRDWPPVQLEANDHTLNNITQDFLDSPGTGRTHGKLISSTPALSNTEAQSNKQSAVSETQSECHNNSSKITAKPLSKSLFNNVASSRKRPIDEILSTNAHLQGPRSLFANNSSQASTSHHGVTFNINALKNYEPATKPAHSNVTLRSPFYPGRTTYGGASAYSIIPESLTTSAEVKKPLRSSIQIQPLNQTKANPVHIMSQTARRIMEALDQFTTPLSTVERTSPAMPALVQTRKRFGMEERLFNQSLGINQRSTNTKPYLRQSGNTLNRSFNRELQVATVPDLLKMRKRERLQDSTKSVRQLAKDSNSELNKPLADYHFRTETEESAGSQIKHTSKLKSKVTKTRHGKHADVETEMAPILNLPTVQLSMTSLPKFDIIQPPSSLKLSSSNIQTSKKQPKPTVTVATKAKVAPTKSVAFSVGLKTLNTATTFVNNVPAKEMESFKFSLPIQVFNTTNTAIATVNNFIFSAPLNVSMENKLEMKFDATNVKLKRKSGSGIVSPKSSGISVAQELKSGSIMDIIKPHVLPSQLSNNAKIENNLDTFRPSSTTTWECQSCLLRNKNEVENCAACEKRNVNKIVPKSEIPAAKLSSFGDAFKLSADKWECQICMVPNDVKSTKCIACETQKPILSKSAPLTGNPPLAGFVGFGDQFKPSSDSWCCDVCMIKNQNTDNKCVACETPKPGIKSACSKNVLTSKPPTTCTDAGFIDLIKQQNSKWECNGCMTRNDYNRAKCGCCEAPKPGVIPETAQFSFGSVPITEFKFGIDKATDIPNNVLSKATGFSGFAEAKSVASFTFGIPTDKESLKKEVRTPPGLLKASDKITPEPTFCFGIPKTTQASKTEEVVKISELKSNKVVTSKSPVTSTSGYISKQTSAIGVAALAATTVSSAAKPISISTLQSVVTAPAAKLSVSSSSISANYNPKPVGFSTSRLSTSTTTSKSLFTFGTAAATSTSSALSSNLVTSSTSSLPNSQSLKPATNSMFTFAAVNNLDNKLKLDNSKVENNGPAPKKATYGEFSSAVSTAEPPNPTLPGFGSSGGFGTVKPLGHNPGFQFGATEKSFGFNNTDGTLATQQKPDMFSFGAKVDTKKTSSGTFAFTGSTTAVTVPSFGYGALNKPAMKNTQPNMFGLPSQNVAAPVMSFSAPAMPVSSGVRNPTAIPAFGAVAATPTFGSANSSFGNPIPAHTFGANNSPPPAFQFGAPAASQNSAIFAFGATRGSDPLAAASGAFTFGANTSGVPQVAAAAQAAPNAFSSEVTPSFNFNMGTNPSAFTAPATGGAAAGRKIKRAVRRTPR